MKYTPGPWRAVNDTLVRGPHGEAIASTKGFAYPADPNYAGNAHVIAAVPAMIKTLRDAADIIEKADKLNPCGLWAQELVNRFRAAVAEMEG